MSTLIKKKKNNYSVCEHFTYRRVLKYFNEIENREKFRSGVTNSGVLKIKI